MINDAKMRDCKVGTSGRRVNFGGCCGGGSSLVATESCQFALLNMAILEFFMELVCTFFLVVQMTELNCECGLVKTTHSTNLFFVVILHLTIKLVHFHFIPRIASRATKIFS